jgi:hypothetical protein
LLQSRESTEDQIGHVKVIQEIAEAPKVRKHGRIIHANQAQLSSNARDLFFWNSEFQQIMLVGAVFFQADKLSVCEFVHSKPTILGSNRFGDVPWLKDFRPIPFESRIFARVGYVVIPKRKAPNYAVALLRTFPDCEPQCN